MSTSAKNIKEYALRFLHWATYASSLELSSYIYSDSLVLPVRFKYSSLHLRTKSLSTASTRIATWQPWRFVTVPPDLKKLIRYNHTVSTPFYLDRDHCLASMNKCCGYSKMTAGCDCYWGVVAVLEEQGRTGSRFKRWQLSRQRHIIPSHRYATYNKEIWICCPSGWSLVWSILCSQKFRYRGHDQTDYQVDDYSHQWEENHWFVKDRTQVLFTSHSQTAPKDELRLIEFSKRLHEPAGEISYSRYALRLLRIAVRYGALSTMEIQTCWTMNRPSFFLTVYTILASFSLSFIECRSNSTRCVIEDIIQDHFQVNHEASRQRFPHLKFSVVTSNYKVIRLPAYFHTVRAFGMSCKTFLLYVDYEYWPPAYPIGTTEITSNYWSRTFRNISDQRMVNMISKSIGLSLGILPAHFQV